MITWRTVPALAMLSLGALLMGLVAITEPVAANGGVGWDGVNYRDLVTGLRGEGPSATDAPFVYRVLPSAIVALSGLDVRLGFFALDVAATLATALLLIAMLRPWTTPLGALVAVLVFGLLPYGLRFAIHYAVLPDALGNFLFLVVVYAAMQRRHLLFAIALAAAVLTREHLLFLAPLLAFRELRYGATAVARALVTPAPALAALAWVHLAPPLAPLQGSYTTVDYVAFRTYSILTNNNNGTWRVLAGPFFGLGVLVSPLLSRFALRIVAVEPGWTYLFVMTALTSALGGGDHDRYIAVLAPLLLLVAVRSIPAASRTQLLVVVLALQLLAARLLDPLGSDTASHESFMIFTAPLDRIALWSLTIGAACACAALVFAFARQTARRGAVLAKAQA